MNRVWLEFLWAFCWLFARLPRWVRFGIMQPFIYGVLRLLRYRDGVVTENLKGSFPEKSDRELRKIKLGFYWTLAEIFVDTLSLSRHTTPKRIRKVLRVKGLEEHARAVSGRDWIGLAAHLGCWEYCSYWSMFDPSPREVMAVYHPLSSQVFDALYKRLRNRSGYIETVPMQETVRYYLRHREGGMNGKRIAIGLIADQNPPRRPDSHWFRFLNRDTLFFDGGEKLALKFGLPVYGVWLHRVKAGVYEMSFELLYDGSEQVPDNEITERYVRSLERHIVKNPELWMWSHRRWKHKKS